MIKRFINLLKSPLIPIRLFAVEDDFDFSWLTPEEEEAAENSDTDTSSWEEYNTDFGNVNIQTDGNGNVTGASYKDPTTGEWKDSGLSGHQEYGGHVSEGQAKQAEQVFGASMTPETLAGLAGGNKSDVSTVLEGAANGNPAAVAMATAMTGTVPDPDSLRGLGYTDDQINTAVGFATDFVEGLQNGKSPQDAWKDASTKNGDPYGTNARNEMLKDSIINTITMYGGPLLGAAGKAATGGKVAGLLDKASKANKLSKGAKYTSMAASAGKRGTKVAMQAIEILDKADKVGTAISATTLAGQLGISVAEAKGLIDAYNDDKRRYGDSSDEEGSPKSDTRADTSKEPESTRTTSSPEPTSTRADTGSKSDPTFTNPFGGNDPDPSGWTPSGPLAGTPLSGVGLPGGETNPTPPEPEQEGFSSESDGDDTLEESTQDAPTGGEGSDTFTNTNDDTRKGWGLGEEDPNRANYDNDKWNRGMERVSTDVVSDAKLKNFITKTFKDDPVLIRTMKIIKSKR